MSCRIKHRQRYSTNILQIILAKNVKALKTTTATTTTIIMKLTKDTRKNTKRIHIQKLVIIEKYL